MASPYALGRNNAYPNNPADDADMLAGQDRYAADKQAGNAPYVYPAGYSDYLQSGSTSIPDTARLQQRKLEESYPDPDKPPTEGYYPSQDADKKTRHSAETVEGIPQDFPLGNAQGYPDPHAGIQAFAPNPRSVPPTPSRITNFLAPISYFFTRPFGQGLPKLTRAPLDGTHFSMADHKRNVAYTNGETSMGMIPPRKPGAGTRNTYRLDPTPWDTAYTDMPPSQDSALVESPVSTYGTVRSRSWRL